MRQDAIVVDREKYTYWSIGFFSIRVVYDLHTTYMELTVTASRRRETVKLCHRWHFWSGYRDNSLFDATLHMYIENARRAAH